MFVIIKMMLLLGFLVFIHEGGHFIVAKLCGIKVNKFAIGFGPVLLARKKKETDYELRLLPLGGFVSLEGEEELSNKEGSFSNASATKKIMILLAGAFVNIIFGLIVIFIINSIKYKIDNNTEIGKALLYGANIVKEIIEEVGKSIINLFSGKMSMNDLAGPVGISSIVEKTRGIYEYMYITAIISISLGVTNLLPIIPLDGGKIFLVFIEKIRRKPFSQEMQLKIQSIGLIFLITFSIIVMINDFKKI